MVILVEEEAENQTQMDVGKDRKGERKYEEEGEEKWVKYYSSFHQILLVGDGDFSFSLSLALSFGSASNIVASSLHSYDAVIKKYKNAESNLKMLHQLGAYILHGVDATKMKLHTDLQMRRFDRIVFNFPHAGFHGKEDNARLIGMHRKLVHGFFRNASGMLRANGEIHVNHKTTAPFCHWNLEELANQNSLALIECVYFKIEDYPGYNNKRGAGVRCDEPFPLGECSTFRFRFSPIAKKMSQSRRNMGSLYGTQHQLQVMQTHLLRQPNSFAVAWPSVNQVANMNCIPGFVFSPPSTDTRRSECYIIFGEYFNYAMETFGKIDYNLEYYVHDTLRLGYERYEAEQSGRPLNELIELLEELHHLSNLRSEYLRKALLG